MAKKPLEEYTLDEKLDVIHDFLERVRGEVDKGKAITFVDKKLLGWLDKQVEVGKYRSRSHAIEVLILEKMKKPCQKQK